MSIYHVGNAINELGWKSICTPIYPTLHINIQPANMSQLDHLVDLIKQAVENVRKYPKKYIEGPQKMVEETMKMPSSVTVKAIQNCLYEVTRLENMAAPNK